MHRFHVRFTGENAEITVNVTFKVEARNYADAEAIGWQRAAHFVPAAVGAPALEIRAIHIGECEAGCL